jgi:hypothetical protein
MMTDLSVCGGGTITNMNSTTLRYESSVNSLGQLDRSKVAPTHTRTRTPTHTSYAHAHTHGHIICGPQRPTGLTVAHSLHGRHRKRLLEPAKRSPKTSLLYPAPPAAGFARTLAPPVALSSIPSFGRLPPPSLAKKSSSTCVCSSIITVAESCEKTRAVENQTRGLEAWAPWVGSTVELTHTPIAARTCNSSL